MSVPTFFNHALRATIHRYLGPVEFGLVQLLNSLESPTRRRRGRKGGRETG
jgi:hypothetical protein